jgi:hypothetical protein
VQNLHLNVFEPYRDLPRSHEDQLTRAAMIVLRLVPAARDALLREIGERPERELPPCDLDMQSSEIAPTPEPGEPAAAEIERERLVSVFLTPDIEPFELAEEITDTERGQRFDGVLRFDPELVLVIESKVCHRWARRDGHRAAELNLGGIRFAERRTQLLRWHDLLEAWWQLVEHGTLSAAEQAIVADMLDYANRDFTQLLPFGSLRRAGSDPLRRRRRLRSLLLAATGVHPERSGSSVHVRLDNALGVESLQRAALRIDHDTITDQDELTLHVWPGELKVQAEHLYASGHAERLSELPDDGYADGYGSWRVEPQPLLGFRNAPVRTRVYFTCTLDASTYARRWQGEDWEHVGAHHRNHIQSELWPWLLERGYASPSDAALLDPFMQALGRRFAHLRPSMHVTRSWPLDWALELDEEGLLAEEVRDALNHVLGILEEPLVTAGPLAASPG